MCNQVQSALPKTLIFTDKNEHLQNTHKRACVYSNVNQLGNTETLNQYQVEKTVVVHAVGSIKWA